VKVNADMSANTMIMASSQSTLAGRSASAKPFSGQAIKPTRAVALPRSRAHVVKAVAKVHYRRAVEQSSPRARCNCAAYLETWHARAQHTIYTLLLLAILSTLLDTESICHLHRLYWCLLPLLSAFVRIIHDSSM